MRNHDNAKKEWSDDELKKLYETHERLLDLVSLFCYVPRTKYLPLGPTRYGFLDYYVFLAIFFFNGYGYFTISSFALSKLSMSQVGLSILIVFLLLDEIYQTTNVSIE